MAKVQLDWHGEEAKAIVRAHVVRWLKAACILVSRRAKELLSVAGTGKVAGKRVGPIARSQPGEPPRKQTGRLRASVAYEVDESSLVARVGTNVEYGRHLELGTKKGLAARPWLRRAAQEMRGRVEAAIGQIGLFK